MAPVQCFLFRCYYGNLSSDYTDVFQDLCNPSPSLKKTAGKWPAAELSAGYFGIKKGWSCIRGVHQGVHIPGSRLTIQMPVATRANPIRMKW